MTRDFRYLTVKGFTLTELTIVLVIVALLTGGIMVPLSMQIDQRNYNETRQRLDEVREALIGYALAEGRFPRPATSLEDGIENPNDCANDDQCTGYIPWITLGIKKTDAWNKMIRYSVTPSYAKNNTSIQPTDYSGKKVKTRNAEGVVSYLIGDDDHACGAGADGRVYRCTPVIILSFGKNNWGMTPEGIALEDGSTTNADEDTNASDTKVYFSRDHSNVPNGGEFDDIVTWISPYTLFNRMIAAGRLP